MMSITKFTLSNDVKIQSIGIGTLMMKPVKC